MTNTPTPTSADVIEGMRELRSIALDVLGTLEVLAGCHRTFAAASDLAEPIRKLRSVLTQRPDSKPDKGGA